MKNKNKLAVVVLFWNDFEKTIKCLDSIYKQKKIDLSVILVDNNSKKKYSKKVIKWLRVKKIKIYNYKNICFNPSFFKINQMRFYILRILIIFLKDWKYYFWIFFLIFFDNIFS